MTTAMTAQYGLDGVAAVRHYIDRIVHGDDRIQGGQMKVLLLDDETTQTVSAVYSQTEILNQQVYLVSALKDPKKRKNKLGGGGGASDDSGDYLNGNANGALHHDLDNEDPDRPGGDTSSNSHLKAVCFVRATESSVELLCRELSRPRFPEYHIFFSGILPSGLLRLLAEKDAYERVRQVQEFYADYVPINEDLLTLQCPKSIPMSVSAGTSWAPKHATQYERNLQGLSSILLSMRRQPSCIRYAGHSPCAEELARDLHDAIQGDDIFHFRQGGSRHGPSGSSSSGGGCLLLILDRKDDPVTPLLTQWTYQAMVHELIGLNNHRVDLRGAPSVPKDLKEVVLSATQDDFFAANRHSNFGKLGEEIQKLLRDYQKQTAQHSPSNLNSIEEMQQFMEKFPELRSRSHKVSKHVAIMGELARLVEVGHSMDVSQFEQELACADDHTAHWRELHEKLQSPQIKVPDKLRLGLLYALKYEVPGNIHMVQAAMNKAGVPGDMVSLINTMLKYGGTKSRGPGLYGEDHTLMSKMTKSFMSSVQGCENVYSQHVPLLMDTIQSIMKGKLSPKTHPIVPGSERINLRNYRPPAGVIGAGASSNATVSADQVVPQEIIIFMVGGVTYEEGTKIAEFNAANQGRVRVLLAGSTVHNSASFLDELKATEKS